MLKSILSAQEVILGWQCEVWWGSKNRNVCCTLSLLFWNKRIMGDRKLLGSSNFICILLSNLMFRGWVLYKMATPNPTAVIGRGIQEIISSFQLRSRRQQLALEAGRPAIRLKQCLLGGAYWWSNKGWLVSILNDKQMSNRTAVVSHDSRKFRRVFFSVFFLTRALAKCTAGTVQLTWRTSFRLPSLIWIRSIPLSQ